MGQAPRTLPLTVLPLGVQRYSCHGCGDCCRDFTVQLRPADLERLRAQGWQERLGEPVTMEFRGVTYLRQRADGACVFLQPGGQCQIHAELGLEAKPLACQLFPFVLAPRGDQAMVGLSFACQSVQRNKGASLASHMREVGALAAKVAELTPTGTLLAPGLPAEPSEVDIVADAVDRWLRDAEVPMVVRLDGLAWLAQKLGQARLAKVRGPRLRELMNLLVTALPDELPLCPVEPPTRALQSTLRQAAFFRLEDPKVNELARVGRWRAVLAQYARSRAFARGRGTMPAMGDRWPDGVRFDRIERVQGALAGPDAPAVNDLLARWLRATILGGRAWGSGFYGWPIVEGLQALALNAACTLWLARAHAAAHDRDQPTLADVEAALGRVDRASGRAPWLGSRAERLRLRYLAADDGLRRIL